MFYGDGLSNGLDWWIWTWTSKCLMDWTQPAGWWHWTWTGCWNGPDLDWFVTFGPWMDLKLDNDWTGNGPGLPIGRTSHLFAFNDLNKPKRWLVLGWLLELNWIELPIGLDVWSWSGLEIGLCLLDLDLEVWTWYGPGQKEGWGEVGWMDPGATWTGLNLDWVFA